MANKVKSIFKAMLITNIIILISCFTLASTAQSAGIAGIKHEEARNLDKEMIETMQADETPLLDNINCVISGIVVLLDDIPDCNPHRRLNRSCVRTLILEEINNLVSCMADSGSEGLLFATCNIGVIYDGVQGGLNCDRDDKTCITSVYLNVILDFIRCVSVYSSTIPPS